MDVHTGLTGGGHGRALILIGSWGLQNCMQLICTANRSYMDFLGLMAATWQQHGS